MSHQKWCIAATSLVLMGGTAFLIGRLQANQELGRPALRVVSEPIFDPDGKQVGTNSVYLPEVVLDFSSEALPVTPLELGWLPPDTTYGRRLYKGADGFEVAVRAILGQQATVAAARTVAGRFAAALGDPVDTPFRALTTVFPTAARVAPSRGRGERGLGPHRYSIPRPPLARPSTGERDVAERQGHARHRARSGCARVPPR